MKPHYRITAIFGLHCEKETTVLPHCELNASPKNECNVNCIRCERRLVITFLLTCIQLTEQQCSHMVSQMTNIFNSPSTR